MACTCFGLAYRRQHATKEAQDVDASKPPRICEHSKAPDVPQVSADQDDALSLASCSLSVVDASGSQDPLRLNIPYVPLNGFESRRPSTLSRQTCSLDLPQLYLARTQTSKEETSLLQKATCQHAHGSSIKGMDMDSKDSLELATDMAVEQLGTVQEAPASAANPSTPHEWSPSAIPGSAAMPPDDWAMCQDWGRSMSPIAQQASPAVSPASSHAAQSAKCAANMSTGVPECAVSRSPVNAAKWCDLRTDSTSRMAAAIQEAEACRTRSDENEDDAPGTLMWTSSFPRMEDHPMQSSQNRAFSPSKRSGTERCHLGNPDTESALTAAEPKAVTAYQPPTTYLLTVSGASNYAEARAHRRRTRQVTVQADQENLLAIQASMPEGPHPPVQRPLKSRTNMLGRRAASLQTDSDPCHDDKLLRAALRAIPSGYKASQTIITREDVYKPLSAQLTSAEHASRGSKSPQAQSAAAWCAASRCAAEAGPQHDTKQEQEMRTFSTAHTQKQQGLTSAPTYMRSTASMRAKVDVAAQQLEACKAAQRDKRRWSH